MRYPAILGDETIEDAITKAQGIAESVPDGTSVQRLISAAMKHNIHVVFGLIEAGKQPGIFYDTLVLAGPQGYIGSYRKVHLTLSENFIFRPGDNWPVFDMALGRVGLLICYDKSSPEGCRELTLSGAELLVIGSAWAANPGHGDRENNSAVRRYDLFDRVRALENSRWLISSNFVGELGGSNFIGFSQIVDPLGGIVVSSGLDQIGVVTAEIDICAGLAGALVAYGGPRLIRDRRADTYKVLNGSLPVVVDG
ncbi:carbon-nitrogen hydrolase family protein [Mesorhizobium sp.]|uniref:carbon-nitrogen hydrolase family protein n=1 Tax=Mesorhizobium sp. TaxID=1871066 RepID=UPI000FE8DA92|nr:carbon-nitrogen hydrolase family protein [Mesorhizobium sp.]RWD41513.1 MAG: carbon-nitrogen hydrolase family protein [Mesorhizobium sp.]